MQIVIDIPEKWYRWAKFNNIDNGSMVSKGILDAVKNGIPLPKGHGRLIDESDLMPDSDYEDGTFYAVSIGQINLAPTIIEADKSESEDKLDGDPIDIDKAVEHYEKTLETLKGIDLEVDE